MYNISHLLLNETLNIEVMEDIAKTTYYTLGISTTIFNASNESVFTFGVNTQANTLFLDVFDNFNKYLNEVSKKEINGIYTFTTPYDFSYITVVLADEAHYYGSFLVGPILLNYPSEHLLNEIIQRNSMSMSERNQLKNIYDSMPVVASPRTYYIYKMLAQIITNKDLVSDFYSDLQITHEQLSNLDVLEKINTSKEPELANHNYSLERLFMNKVASGDAEKVIEIFNEYLKTHYFTKLGPNQLRSTKNNAIVFCTLLARAAIEGGVEPDTALSLADKYINRIEYFYKYDELIHLFEKMIVKFTNSVLQISNINHVSVIKKSSKYVHNHLSEPIRLHEVAEYVGLSPNYFSSLFKKEMNLAFADYVNQTRIKESQYLLQTTNHSILDIAIAVGYNNQNYFTTIFKKFSGITPKQYRMRSTK